MRDEWMAMAMDIIHIIWMANVYRVPSHEFMKTITEKQRKIMMPACLLSPSKKYSLIAFALIFYWIINNPQVRDKP